MTDVDRGRNEALCGHSRTGTPHSQIVFPLQDRFAAAIFDPHDRVPATDTHR